MFHMNQILSNSLKQKELINLASFLRRIPNRNIQLKPTSAASQISVKDSKNQNAVSIPSFPVQPLEETLERYVKSIKPFVNSSQLENTKKLAKNLALNDVGRKLQKLLEERASKSENWLADWWLSTAYLEYRSPVVIYSSPGLVWPEQTFANQNDQINYAANVVAAALGFNQVIEAGKIPQEMLGGRHPLCMSQYNKIFGTCRIPKIPKDDLLFQDPKNPSRNIVVIYNNHLFSMPAFEEGSRKPLSAAQFYGMLQDIVAKGTAEGPAIGILTTEHRDNWAKSYEELKKNETNRRNLEEVEKSLFVVCIDNPLTTGSGLNYGTRCSKLLLHGFGIRGNGGNRWYDKTIQFIIGAGSDGVGIAYEHSPAEGGPIGILTDFVIDQLTPEITPNLVVYTVRLNLFTPCVRKTVPKLEAPGNYPAPKKLDFIVNDTVNNAIQAAGKELDRLSNDLDVFGFTFPHFGKNQLKQAKVSPDSFIQIAIQYAFYKIHRHPAAQYESGSLRKYVYGRTDIIRTCLEEVVYFCKTMTDEKSTKEEKRKSLLAAIEAHKNYATEVVHGRGVDRHLLGLKILAGLNNMQLPEFFSDAAYQKSTYFQLSTSNVPSKCDGFMVYGPLVDDGYACCYNPRDDSINFGTSAWSTCRTTKLNSFKEALESGLIEMKKCLPTSTVQSKL